MKKVFVTRNFEKNASEITREEFVAMMRADVEVAIAEFREWTAVEGEKKYQVDNEAYKIRRADKVERIIAESYKKYKREFYRLRYVEREIASIPENLDRSYSHKSRELDGINWDIKPCSNGCTLIMWGSKIYGINEYDPNYLERYVSGLYDEAIKNKYFLRCTGWSIVEDFTTEFKFHLSEEVQEEWKADEKKLADDINRFYAGSNWWGD